MTQNTYRMSSSTQPPPRGAVLLEVVLSLAIFFIAAAIIYGGISSGTRAVQTIRTRMHATDLAVTKISEMRMGLLQPIAAGPESYTSERLKDWQWQIETGTVETTGEGQSMTQVTVTITETKLNRQYQLTTILSPSYGGNLD